MTIRKQSPNLVLVNQASSSSVASTIYFRRRSPFVPLSRDALDFVEEVELPPLLASSVK